MAKFFYDLSPSTGLGIRYVTVSFKGWKVIGAPTGDYPRAYTIQKEVVAPSSDEPDPPESLPKIELEVVVKDNCRAIFDPSVSADTPINSARLKDLATAITANFVSWRGLSFDYVFSGIISLPPTAVIDTVEVAYLEDDATTRIYTFPFNYEPGHMSHYDWDAEQPTPANNRFVSPSGGIAPGKGAVCTTQRKSAPTAAGDWSDTGTAMVYNPSPGQVFAPNTQGVWTLDQWGDCIIVEEDCPGGPSGGA